jgi:hypothetical protein
MTTKTFPAAEVDALAGRLHQAAYDRRGDRYATPEELAMILADPMGWEEMIRPELRAALGLSDQFGSPVRKRSGGEEVISYHNVWDEFDDEPAEVEEPAALGPVQAQLERCLGELNTLFCMARDAGTVGNAGVPLMNDADRAKRILDLWGVYDDLTGAPVRWQTVRDR